MRERSQHGSHHCISRQRSVQCAPSPRAGRRAYANLHLLRSLQSAVCVMRVSVCLLLLGVGLAAAAVPLYSSSADKATLTACVFDYAPSECCTCASARPPPLFLSPSSPHKLPASC